MRALSVILISLSEAQKSHLIGRHLHFWIQMGKDEKFRMTNLEWGVDFFSLTNLVKTS